MKYDAFISYNRADAQLAKTLHSGLTRLERSFLGFGAKRIFLDTFSFPPGEKLPRRLSDVLGQSKYLILLASPESARSRFVEEELSAWLANRPIENLIIVLAAGGELSINRKHADLGLEAANVLPPILSNRLEGKAVTYIDLRWTRGAEDFEERYQFLDAVASISARLEGISRDTQLDRYTRRAARLKRLTYASVVILGVLLVMTAASALYARRQLERARREMAVAREQERIAEMQQEIAESERNRTEAAMAEAHRLREEVERLRHSSRVPVSSNPDPELEQRANNAETEAADWRRRSEDAAKLADQYKQQYEAQARLVSDLIKPSGQGQRSSYVGEFIKQNLTFFVFAVILSLVVTLLSTRLVLLLLQLEIGLIKPIAIGFFYTPFGRWKLYRKYRKGLREDANLHYHAEHYIDLPFETSDTAALTKSLEPYLKESVISRNVCVLAGGGRGKTTLAYKLALLSINGQLKIGNKAPIPVVVDGLTYDGNLVEAITATLTQQRVYVNSAIVASQLTAGNILVILDGWSEVREFYSDPKDSTADIPKFINKHPDTRFIFTSRGELPASIRQALGNAATVTLKDLNDDTLEQFLGKYIERRKEELPTLVKEINTTPSEIPLTPLMVRLVAEIYDRTGQVPKDRISLFALYMDKLFRPEIIGQIDVAGLLYVIKHLVRNTYIASEGNRGFSIYKGVELIEQIKVMIGNFDIRLLPIDLLRLLAHSGLYKRSGEYFRFFHDSFESYFAARVLDDDFREQKYDLLALCASNVRFIEAIGFLISLCRERNEEEKLLNAIEQARRLAQVPVDVGVL